MQILEGHKHSVLNKDPESGSLRAEGNQMCSFCDPQPNVSGEETGSGQGAGELHPWVSVLQPSGGSHGFPGLSRHTGKEG